MPSIKNYELRVKRVAVSEAPGYYGRCIHSSGDVAELAKQLIGDLAQEVMLAFVLDIKNKVLGYSEIGRGSSDSCPVDVRQLFRVAVALGATNIIIAHNHPSGNLDVSPEDLSITRRVSEAGKILGINLLDHVIVSDEGTFSLYSAGMLEM